MLCNRIFNDTSYLFIDCRDGPQRRRFNVKRFAEKYNLEGPIAGNFLVAGYDDNVPAYHRHLGFV